RAGHLAGERVGDGGLALHLEGLGVVPQEVGVGLLVPLAAAGVLQDRERRPDEAEGAPPAEHRGDGAAAQADLARAGGAVDAAGLGAPGDPHGDDGPEGGLPRLGGGPPAGLAVDRLVRVGAGARLMGLAAPAVGGPAAAERPLASALVGPP